MSARKKNTRKVMVFALFDGFETLGAFGPIELFGQMSNHFTLRFCSLDGGIITSSQGVKVQTEAFSTLTDCDIVLIPGGIGVRCLVEDSGFLATLDSLLDGADNILTVCNGTALLAHTGRLDGRRATTNKRVFDWVVSQRPAVDWQRKARWVVDGNIYTASGVSAGMDMALGFIADTFGHDIAQGIATIVEYVWSSDPTNDPFAISDP
jgi:transcriptional regulator GlxA family with amidase domain